MRKSILLAILVVGATLWADEPLTAARKAERLYLFRDVKGFVVASRRIPTMSVPMESRLRFQEKYLIAANTFDYSVSRTAFVREAQKKFTPEELEAVYEFRCRKCFLMTDKLIKVEADVACVLSALVLYAQNGSNDLGDFAIEEAPKDLPAGQLELAQKVVLAMSGPVSDVDSSSLIEVAVRAGTPKDKALAEVDALTERYIVAHAHALAVRLSKADLELLLSGYSDPKLGPLLLRQDDMMSDVETECRNGVTAMASELFVKGK